MTVRGRQRGFLAVMAAVILVVLAAMGAAMFAMVTSGTRGAGEHAHSAQALFLAESGMEWAAKELVGADDPQGDCEALAGSGPLSLPNGNFRILDATYNTSEETCSVTSRGTVDDAVRTVSGVIPKAVIVGAGGNIFENESAWTGQPGAFMSFPSPGVMEFRRNPACHGPDVTATVSNPGQVISDNFQADDEVYFASGLQNVNGGPGSTSLIVRLSIAGQTDVTCNVPLVALQSSPCAAASGHALYDEYNIVLNLGSGFDASDVTEIELEASWGGGATACSFQLAEACIGRESHCGGEVPDPVEDGTWTENP